MTISPGNILATVQVGESIFQIVFADIVAFKNWITANTDAADTAQLAQLDTLLAAGIAEEQQIVGGTTTAAGLPPALPDSVS